jgi:hypothetical protein
MTSQEGKCAAMAYDACVPLLEWVVTASFPLTAQDRPQRPGGLAGKVGPARRFLVLLERE